MKVQTRTRKSFLSGRSSTPLANPPLAPGRSATLGPRRQTQRSSRLIIPMLKLPLLHPLLLAPHPALLFIPLCNESSVEPFIVDDVGRHLPSGDIFVVHVVDLLESSALYDGRTGSASRMMHGQTEPSPSQLTLSSGTKKNTQTTVKMETPPQMNPILPPILTGSS